MVLPGVVRQIGYVVTDFDRTLAGLIELGIGPWFVLRGIEQFLAEAGWHEAVIQAVHQQHGQAQRTQAIERRPRRKGQWHG